MIIEVVCVPFQLVQNERKFFCAHLLRGAVMPVTKGAVHIARIGDFHINSVVHRFLRRISKCGLKRMF